MRPPPAKPVTKLPKTPLVVGAIVAYSVTAYGTYLYHSYRHAIASAKDIDVPEDVSHRYDVTAPTFDADVQTTELVLGIDRRRDELVKKARGHVLEVSVGTGRTMRYYAEDAVRSFTFVDKSGPMMELAKKQFGGEWSGVEWSGSWSHRLPSKCLVFARRTKKERPANEADTPRPVQHPKFKKASFLQQDASEPIPNRPQAGFDTVIQTMGLCSTGRPVELLRNMGAMTNPDGGQILLLEHGRSHYGWLNRLLDQLAKARAHKHGCWWNRDIGRIVEDSGLEVICARRFHLGTTWWFELRPKRRSNGGER